MKAVVYYGPGDVRVEDIPKPECGADELLIKVDACAVCGSDLKSATHGNPRMKAGAPMGHEFSGLIEEIGPEAAGDYKVGDRIVMATSVSCGECAYCQRGWPNICANIRPMGFYYPGGMAEYTTVPGIAVRRGHVIKTPADMKPEHAALAEPTSCAVNSISQCNLQEGDTVLVMGAGPMGLLNVCVAKAAGAGKIILSEVNESRIEQAKAFPIDIFVNPANEDLAEVIKNETDGIGADVVIVAAPAAAPQEQAITLVRKRGTVCLFASLPAGNSNITIDSRPLHYGELNVTGSSDSTPAHVQQAVDYLASGAIPADKVASHIMTLDDIEKAFELMRSGEAMRVVLKP